MSLCKTVPRKLKTYQTSQGFYDLAVAAPSMKAALAAWGSDMNLFHKGFAQETDDPHIIAATLEKPGVVLQRPVGTEERFQEHAHLPKDLPATSAKSRTRKSKRPAGEGKRKISKRGLPAKLDENAARKAALAFQKQEQRQEKQRQNEEAAAAKQRRRRQQAMAEAEATLKKAQGEHDAIAGRLETQRDAIDKRLEAEEARWKKLEERLQGAVRRASRS